eukprot:1397492-Amphidinium_carterae.1
MAGLPLRFPWETPFLNKLRTSVPVTPEGAMRVPALPGPVRSEAAAPRPSVTHVPALSKRDGVLAEWASLLGGFPESEGLSPGGRGKGARWRSSDGDGYLCGEEHRDTKVEARCYKTIQTVAWPLERPDQGRRGLQLSQTSGGHQSTTEQILRNHTSHQLHVRHLRDQATTFSK